MDEIPHTQIAFQTYSGDNQIQLMIALVAIMEAMAKELSKDQRVNAVEWLLKHEMSADK